MDMPDLLRHNEINYLGALYVLDAVIAAPAGSSVNPAPGSAATSA
jgi:hypothetical protein